MHVGLNLVYLIPGISGGTETMIRALLPELVKAAPATRFTAFVNHEMAGEDLGVEQVLVPVRATSRAQWVLGEQWHLPRLARDCDLVHSPANTGPGRGDFRRVTTVHDLHYLLADAHFGLRGLGMRALVPLAVRRSDRVITDSAHTRDDLVERLGVAAERIDVVPLGLGRPPGAATPEAELRARYELGDRPVLLSLSAKRPHKNLAGLLDALPGVEPQPVLVLPGYHTPYERELQERATTLGLDVRWLGWTPDADIEGLFALSRAFVFPSFYEGFGLPVLEAMAREVPVACSDRTSLPEVAGDAALLFDPADPQAIRAALQRLLTDDALAAELAVAGRERAATYTWERTARATLASYERAL